MRIVAVLLLLALPAEAEARRLGLLGWVRNLPDGRLEAFFQGPYEKVEAAVAWSRRGPAESRADKVEASSGRAAEDLREFRVRE